MELGAKAFSAFRFDPLNLYLKVSEYKSKFINYLIQVKRRRQSKAEDMNWICVCVTLIFTAFFLDYKQFVFCKNKYQTSTSSFRNVNRKSIMSMVWQPASQ